MQEDEEKRSARFIYLNVHQQNAALVRLQLPEASARSQSPDGVRESHMLTMMFVWKLGIVEED